MKQLEEQARKLRESIEKQSKENVEWGSVEPSAIHTCIHTRSPHDQTNPPIHPPTQTPDTQPSIQRLKAIFKRPQQQAFAAQPRRPAPASKPKAEKAAPKPQTTPAAMEAEAAPAAPAPEQEEGEEEGVVEMEVDAKKGKGRKARLVTRVKQSGVKFAAKKQKGAKK